MVILSKRVLMTVFFGCAASAGGTQLAFAQAAAGATTASELAEVTVTGSRLANTGFTAPTPVTVLGREQIEGTAATQVYDLTNTIPSFRPSAGPTNSTQGIRTAAQAILDLRGLGGARTLTLVNGVRLTPVNGANAYDTNLLPTSLIDRVEVVTGGASAAYGSDAVAGVVNFVLKNRMEGFASTVQYGVTQQSDGKEPLVSLGYGTAFADNRGHFIVGADVSRNNGIASIYERKWGLLEPGLVSLPANRAAGLPANLITNNAERKFSSGGGVIASGPLAGVAFDANGQPFQMVVGTPNGASQMVGTGNYGSIDLPGLNIMGAYSRAASLARVEYDLTSDLTAHAQFNYGQLFTHTTAGSFQPADIIINVATNPYIPASVKAAAVAAGQSTFVLSKVAVPGGDILPNQSGNSLHNYNLAVGLEGKFGAAWHWDVSLQKGITNSIRAFKYQPKVGNFYAAVYAVTSPTGAIVCGPLATNPNFANRAAQLVNVEPGCQPYNPFGTKNSTSASLAYIDGTTSVREVVKMDNVIANLSGEVFHLPAGPVSVASGIEFREHSINSVSNIPPGSVAFYANENNVSYAASYNTKEIYGEASIPLLKDAAFAKALSLNTAVRLTNYSTSGSVTTWKAGAAWQANDMILIRGTRSRDIRAPGLIELFQIGGQGSGTLRNNNTSATVIGFGSGNPKLKPEIADTTTVGLTFQTAGFHASVDYWNIKITDVIAAIGGQETVDRCNAGQTYYCQFITFDPNVPIGIASTFNSPQNLAQLETKGYDVELAYRLPLDKMNIPGQFDIRLLGTNTAILQTTNYSVTGVKQVVKNAGFSTGNPKWVWNGNFTYGLGNFRANMNVRYSSPIRYLNTLIGPDDPGYSSTLSNSVSRNLWPSALYYNPDVSYTIPSADGSGRVQFFARVTNLMDKDPPIVAVLMRGGSTYDLIGRAYKVGVRVDF